MANTPAREDRGYQLAMMVKDLSSVDWAISKALADCKDTEAGHALTLAMMTLNNVGRQMDGIAESLGAARSGAFDMQPELDLAAA
jgi:hypothetical protein